MWQLGPVDLGFELALQRFSKVSCSNCDSNGPGEYSVLTYLTVGYGLSLSSSVQRAP